MQDRIKTLKIITASILIFIVLLLLAMCINFVKLAKANNRQKQLEAQLASLETQYELNEDELTLKLSEDYITRYARLYLDMKGKDESVYSGK